MLAVLIATALVAGLLLASPTTEASHWCGETNVSVNPPIVGSGIAQVFAIRLDNTGSNDTQLTSVQIDFDWETNPRTLAADVIVAGGSLDYTVTSSAIPAGIHTVTLTMIGTNDADGPGSVTCNQTETVTTFGTGGAIFGGLVVILLVVVAVVVVIVVVIVVVVVVASKKKAPPTPPQMPPPPYYPPQAPPP